MMPEQKEEKKMTAAERGIEAHSWTRIWYLGIGGLAALIMIWGGYRLTQRQIELAPSDKATELQMNLAKEEFKLKSTYPGLVLIVCGTAIAAIVVRKRFYFKTQHKDDVNKIPGFTELES